MFYFIGVAMDRVKQGKRIIRQITVIVSGQCRRLYIFYVEKEKIFKIVLLLYWSKIYSIIGLLVLLSDLLFFPSPLRNFALEKILLCVLSFLPQNSPNFLYIHIEFPRTCCVSCPKFHARRNLFCFKLWKYQIFWI